MSCSILRDTRRIGVLLCRFPSYSERISFFNSLTETNRFHCLFCHGYEERDSPSAGILAIGDLSSPLHSLFVSRFANRLASKITIYTNGNASATEEIQNALSALKPTSKTAQNVTINSQKILRFVKGAEKADVEVHLEDGSVKVEGFLAHNPKGVVNGPFVEQLGLKLTANGKVVVNAPFNETSVGGVFSVGDASVLMASVTTGIASAGESFCFFVFVLPSKLVWILANGFGVGAVAAGLAAQLGAED